MDWILSWLSFLKSIYASYFQLLENPVQNGRLFSRVFPVSLQPPLGYVKEKGRKRKLYFLCVYQGDKGVLPPPNHYQCLHSPCCMHSYTVIYLNWHHCTACPCRADFCLPYSECCTQIVSGYDLQNCILTIKYNLKCNSFARFP